MASATKEMRAVAEQKVATARSLLCCWQRKNHGAIRACKLSSHAPYRSSCIHAHLLLLLLRPCGSTQRVVVPARTHPQRGQTCSTAVQQDDSDYASLAQERAHIGRGRAAPAMSCRQHRVDVTRLEQLPIIQPHTCTRTQALRAPLHPQRPWPHLR